MKKIVLFLMALLFITACSKNEFTPMTQEEMITQSYNEAFIKTFGQPAANQDWGFETIGISATRGAETNSNQWGTNENNGKYKDVLKKDDIPAITSQELEDVLAVFNQKGKETYTSLIDWSTFFVQQVFKGTAEYTAGNGGKVVGGNQMDWLCAYDPVGKEETIYPDWNNWQATTVTNHDDHVNNFNNANGSVMLMMNSSTSRFGYKSSTDNGHVFYYFRMERINGMYYVGFDFSAEGQNPNEQVQRDLIYNDWIVKIVPGQGYSKPTPSIRIIAEDLSAREGSDFDFNDVVFDVTFTSDNTADITLIAAGGTLPLTVAGQEVHSKFGVNTDVMVNTGAGPTKAPVTFSIGGINRSQNGKDIEIVVQKNGMPCVLTAQKGVPASKIGVPPTFDYCSERQDISKKYPLFSTWVQNGPNVVWWEP